MHEITDAVVLMAGTGSRLRASGEMLPKPLVPIFGRPLITYIIAGLQKAGVRNLHAVVGANADLLVASLRPLIPSEMRLNPIPNPDWEKQNGLSVLCAAGHPTAPFFLTMGDHLFDPSLLAQVAEQAEPGELNLAVDRKIDAIFDLDDAMKVQTTGDRVRAIGKTLATYDAIDTGVFLCPNELFDYLRRARRNGDCSLADGVRLMAEEGKVRAVDIGAAWWQDVDTFEMRTQAEEMIQRSRQSDWLGSAGASPVLARASRATRPQRRGGTGDARLS
ncbi:MAG: NTP transferase domain-containing protein [Verrucomicrobiota bacterium]|nr:NTP transferase domain-containing protein [Verrucomicrobiota bacterium]